MKHIIVNIGLHTEDGKGITRDEAIFALRALNFKVLEHTVVASDSEPTLVARVTHIGDPRACAHWTAERLRQQCIALWYPATQHGDLVGPQASAWGPFNPAFFVLLDGSRLSTHLEPSFV